MIHGVALRFPAASLALACLCLLLSGTAAAQDALSSNDLKLYRQALSALDRGKSNDALAFAKKAKGGALGEIVRGEVMGMPGNPFGFAEIISFIERHPEWPGMDDMRRMVERKMPDNWPASQKVRWFEARTPITIEGFYQYMNGLFALGRQDEAVEIIKKRWVDDTMNPNEMQAFRDRYGNYLSLDDHWLRLNRLLWDQKESEALATARLLPQGYQALARARLALANERSNVEGLIAAVPSNMQGDPGLLFERIRWRRKNGNDDGAIDLLQNAPSTLERPDLWWNERHILIRRLIERRDLRGAYALAVDHNMTDKVELQQAEFLTGWLGMRFMGRPDDAAERFRAMYEKAGTPISKSRAAYWLGRAYDAMKSSSEGNRWYRIAAQYPTSFYGQLAMARVSPGATLTLDEVSAGPKTRTAFNARPLVDAVWQLKQAAEGERMERAFSALSNSLTEEADFYLLADLGKKLGRQDLMVKASKDANQKGFILAISGYPLLTEQLPRTLEPALVHGVIRQESMFKRTALSTAGARGLMQLMPATAKSVARKHGIKIGKGGLYDAMTSVKLGSHYLKERIDAYDGSLPMALAGYNAGPGRVREWVGVYGDPRLPNIDPVDWIELIPIYETRNYVQRVMEGMIVYRSRLNKNAAPLTITNDLR